VLVRDATRTAEAYGTLGSKRVVVKAQILSGKRKALGGIMRCASAEEVKAATERLLGRSLGGLHVLAVLVEEELSIASEHYLSVTYDTQSRNPVLLYGKTGGEGIEDRATTIGRMVLDIRQQTIDCDTPFANKLWQCFRDEDARVLEINPFAKTRDGRWVACDAKVALDDAASFRHASWISYEPRTMLGRPPTERERRAAAIDEGTDSYRGTASTYIELDGDIGVLFAGGGASIANMDALESVGLRAANFSEYSGNPPREKVRELSTIVMSKPGLRGLWIAGGVANFTSIAETFAGIVDALEDVRPSYPIVVRRAGPDEAKGMELMAACAKLHGLSMTLFGKEISMSESAKTLAALVRDHPYGDSR
jgi:succinyl-CoA synthetase beta subunit